MRNNGQTTTKDAKSKNNLKARLRRLCERKKGGKLNVPEWLHDAWKSGDHLSMALDYEKSGFDKEQCFSCFSRQGAFIHVHVDVKQSSMPLPGSSFWWGHILTGAVHQAMWEDHHGDREAIEYDRCGLVLKGRHANRSEVEYESWIIIIWFLFKPANLLTWNRRPFASFCNKFPC